MLELFLAGCSEQNKFKIEYERLKHETDWVEQACDDAFSETGSDVNMY